MMQKLSIVFMVTLVSVVSFLGIWTQRVQATTSDKHEKTLIIYFSMSNTTKYAAELIKQKTGADIVRLERKEAYPEGYDNYARVADNERRKKIHPAIKKNIPNLKQYKTILIGYPTWWQRPPMVIYSLFDNYNFKGKTIIPFTTSMSDPMKASMGEMRKLAKKDGAKIKEGIRYDDNEAQLDRFLRRNDLLK